MKMKPINVDEENKYWWSARKTPVGFRRIHRIGLICVEICERKKWGLSLYAAHVKIRLVGSRVGYDSPARERVNAAAFIRTWITRHDESRGVITVKAHGNALRKYSRRDRFFFCHGRTGPRIAFDISRARAHVHRAHTGWHPEMRTRELKVSTRHPRGGEIGHSRRFGKYFVAWRSCFWPVLAVKCHFLLLDLFRLFRTFRAPWMKLLCATREVR